MVHEHRHEMGEMGLTAGELEAVAYRNQAWHLQQKLKALVDLARQCQSAENPEPLAQLLKLILEGT